MATHILVFLAFFAISMYIDMHSHKNHVDMDIKDSFKWFLFWIFVAVLFNLYIFLDFGTESALLFASGYLVEKSLSVDNLMVIMAIITSFGIKREYTRRILYWGVLGAFFLRLVFVGICTFSTVMFGKYALGVFGIIVLFTAYKMAKSLSTEAQEVEDYTNHWSVKMLERTNRVTPKTEGQAFALKIDGKWMFTPLFLCLVCIEFADVLFALDSVPAVIAITHDPYLVFTSNVFAILGLRSLYFLLEAAKDKLYYLQHAVIFLLMFIGVKMMADMFGLFHVPTSANLIVIAMSLTIGGIVSVMFPKVSN